MGRGDFRRVNSLDLVGPDKHLEGGHHAGEGGHHLAVALNETGSVDLFPRSEWATLPPRSPLLGL